MERIRYRNNLGQVITVTVEGPATRGAELVACAHYLAACLGTDADEHGVVGMGDADLIDEDEGGGVSGWLAEVFATLDAAWDPTTEGR